ncbi:MAG: hypothetical protein RIA08_08590 [Roseovarius sp.]|uniref:hypothetical protein n=1 Tax=Roseovarius sp. TaxID=1486281 RepID=UPI0032ECFAD4
MGEKRDLRRRVGLLAVELAEDALGLTGIRRAAEDVKAGSVRIGERGQTGGGGMEELDIVALARNLRQCQIRWVRAGHVAVGLDRAEGHPQQAGWIGGEIRRAVDLWMAVFGRNSRFDMAPEHVEDRRVEIGVKTDAFEFLAGGAGVALPAKMQGFDRLPPRVAGAVGG